MNLRWCKAPPDFLAPDAKIPGWAVRVALALLGVLLTMAGYGVNGWLALGIPLSVAAAWAPQFRLPWVLILFLAAGQFTRHAGLSWQLLVLLAGLHMLHVLALLSLELPWRAWLQPAVLRIPLLRYLAIQIPSQLVAVVALLLLAPRHHGRRPVTVTELAVVGAVALGCLALLLLRPREEEPHHG